MDTVIVTTEASLEKIISRVIDKKMPKPPGEGIERTFSINQVAKMLRRSHKKISDLVNGGILKCTPDRRIYESSLEEYNRK
ncbi:helix-turn-helix domain-containing protein [Dysgonomonas sp.]